MGVPPTPRFLGLTDALGAGGGAEGKARVKLCPFMPPSVRPSGLGWGVGGGGLLTLADAPSILGGPPGLAQPLDIRTLPLVLSSPSCPWAP